MNEEKLKPVVAVMRAYQNHDSGGTLRAGSEWLASCHTFNEFTHFLSSHGMARMVASSDPSSEFGKKLRDSWVSYLAPTALKKAAERCLDFEQVLALITLSKTTFWDTYGNDVRATVGMEEAVSFMFERAANLCNHAVFTIRKEAVMRDVQRSDPEYPSEEGLHP